MNDLLISLLVFAVIFGGALIGVVVRPRLSERHLQPDSRDVVKMATGLIGTLAALVLGLLIASAKSSFDQKTGQVRQVSAQIILLDDLLAQYGPETIPVRTRLRQGIPPLADGIWHEGEIPAAKSVRFKASAQSSAFENELERLSPTNDVQRSLQLRAIAAFTEGAQTRLLYASWRFYPDTVSNHSGFLAGRDFRQLHSVRANQSGRDGLIACLRAVVFRSDFSGSGTGQPFYRADGGFKRDAAQCAFAALSS